ncbi:MULTISPECIES: hypothetical protein [Streptomyces]|uniref:Uncharacterized protein n=1 Tax=Streptomyces eurythermus TaxID=42237 RepID=A0ABW6YQJ3_9ACTN|nr:MULTISPECIES: hypothetical protein [Streptomyces]QIS74358.1 hypothetical protein HB370_33865 [Streptomyces sp. DSM 40868]
MRGPAVVAVAGVGRMAGGRRRPPRARRIVVVGARTPRVWARGPGPARNGSGSGAVLDAVVTGEPAGLAGRPVSACGDSPYLVDSGCPAS